MNKKCLTNPTLQGYVDAKGVKIKLNTWVEDELINLSYIYMCKHGRKPPREAIRSWVCRLNLAYHEKIITETE